MEQLAHTDIIEKLEQLAISHIDIKSHYRWNFADFDGDVKEGTKFPLMTFESPTIIPSNNENNILLEFHVAFNILGMDGVDTSDPEDEIAQNLVLNNSLNIALEMYRKLIEINGIAFESNVKNKWYSILQKLQVSFTKVGPVTNAFLYGYRCEFVLNPKLKTKIDPAKWV